MNTKRLIVVSYRLPFKVITQEDGSKTLQQSSGGLVSAILSLAESEEQNYHIHWFGYGDQDLIDLSEQELSTEQFTIHPIYIEEELNNRYYEGFCNSTIWPISHYYPYLTTFNEEDFEAYKTAQQVFKNRMVDFVKPNDTVWIHDYQLMLLPELLRQIVPELTIGYFHHIPFPTFEIFRLVPKNWQLEILSGLLGADLIGFHTNDYAQYFLRSVQKVVGWDYNNMNIQLSDRLVKVDVFPISIHYDKFNDLYDDSSVQARQKEFKSAHSDEKIVFSVDRLDYSKGLINRLHGYELFLENYPEWHEKAVFIMVVVPSRETVIKYAEMKHELDEAIGRINGKYGTVAWRPIVYLYRSLSLDELAGMYTLADVALITPVRDGMNLVAKEFVSSRKDKQGVLILSEMAGAALELTGALLVNPTDKKIVAESIYNGLTMDTSEQEKRMSLMQDRIKSYNIFNWSGDFIQQLNKTKKMQSQSLEKAIQSETIQQIHHSFNDSNRRLFLLDYDGTLSPIINDPNLSIPSDGILDTLDKINQQFNVHIAIISGRDKTFLEQLFGNKYILSAEHGAYLKLPNLAWETQHDLSNEWMPEFMNIIQSFVQRTPGSSLEIKETTLVWHYRKSQAELAESRKKELMETIQSHLTPISRLTIMEGDKIIELKPSYMNKGTVANHLVELYQPDFILSMGDDTTDEDMFAALPNYAFTIKVGLKQSVAKYFLKNQQQVAGMLNEIWKE
ncbi:MAG: bifunctional alpha,alpha-trehalose-phosphate synthase (UDP-forming)/trehalose-phosphatase [Cytophagaceae bacterium]